MTRRAVRLERFSCRDFRNLERLDLELPADGLAVTGDNGQGKTSFLEGIYYLQVLRSVRGSRDTELVRFGSEGFHLRAVVHTPDPHELSVGFQLEGRRKRVVRDGVAEARLSDAFGALTAVMFAPRDIQLVSGGPGERRRFLDLVLALSSRRYLSALQKYRAALLRRNAALRDAARTGDEGAAAVWEPQLAENGAVLVCERGMWIRQRADEFSRLCRAIGEEADAVMGYPGSLARESDPAQALAEALERNRKHDLRRGLTHSGPHRDDLHLSLGGHDLRAFGSAGQQRTAAMALRLLEFSTLKESHDGIAPLLLLDDPFSELDARRSERILQLLCEGPLGQTILAVPRPDEIPAELLGLERRRIVEGRLEQGP